jgi:PAS domain S-box-containing protein
LIDEAIPRLNENAMDLRRLGEAFLSGKSDAIIAADKEGTISFWNPGAERIFGYSAAEAVGQSLNIIIPVRLRKRHWDGYRHIMQTARAVTGTAMFSLSLASRKRASVFLLSSPLRRCEQRPANSLGLRQSCAM